MDNIIKTTDNRWLTPIAVAYAIIMLAWTAYCAIATRQASTLHNVTNSTVTSTTMQWASDTAWYGGWK